MTNGEMIQKVFKGCEVCEPIPEEDIIHVIFSDKNDSAIGFDWSWWNAEYKEPNKSEIPTGSTTKNDLGVDAISRKQAIEEADKLCLETGYDNEKVIEMLNDLPSVTPQLSSELDKNSKKLEKDFGELDCIDRAELLKAMNTWDKFGYTETGCFVREPKGAYVPYVRYEDMVNCVKNMPSVTPQEPRKGHWKVVSDGYGDNAYICECSECKDTVWVYKDADRKWNFCSNCGAKMESEE